MLSVGIMNIIQGISARVGGCGLVVDTILQLYVIAKDMRIPLLVLNELPLLVRSQNSQP